MAPDRQGITLVSTPERVEAFAESSAKLLAWQPRQDTLVSRPGRWGDRDFSETTPYFSRVFQMTQDFAGLSVDLLDDSTLDQLTACLNALVGEFERIDQLDTVGMVNTQDVIASNVQAHHDSMLEVYKREIAWLTMFAGRMENWLAQAKSEYDQTRTVRERAEQESSAAAQAADIAREKAGEAGAAEFTGGYRTRAKEAAASAKSWLVVTATAFAVALAATGTFLALHVLGIPAAPTSPAEVLIYLGWRLGTVGLIVASAVWSGRLYRAHMHNSAINLHRAICLDNMRAFHASVQDPGIKDVVALEFSRAATQGMPTGFISAKADGRNDASTQVLSLAAKGIPPQGSP